MYIRILLREIEVVIFKLMEFSILNIHASI